MSNQQYEQPYKGWAIQDIAGSFFFGTATILMMLAAGINMYALLINSGNVFYLENIAATVTISTITACAGLVVKAIPMMVFTHAETKALYYKALFCITAFVIVLWLYFTATTNTGFSIEEILAPDGSKATLSFLMLLVEILLGACTASSWQHYHDKYRPTPRVPNPDLQILEADIAELEAKLEPVNTTVEETVNAISIQEAERNTFIHQQLNALALLKARHQVINEFLGDNE